MYMYLLKCCVCVFQQYRSEESLKENIVDVLVLTYLVKNFFFFCGGHFFIYTCIFMYMCREFPGGALGLFEGG